MKTLLKTTGVFFILIAASCSKDINNKESAVKTNTVTNAQDTSTYHVGEAYGGGIIYYLDSTGKHGLISALEDQSERIVWTKDSMYTVTGADKGGIGTGKENTTIIINALGKKGKYAAALCGKYRGGGYSDWYLPSKDELKLLSDRHTLIGGFTGGNYWSSTEANLNNAWFVHFHRSLVFKGDKSNLYHVRAVRQF